MLIVFCSTRSAADPKMLLTSHMWTEIVQFKYVEILEWIRFSCINYDGDSDVHDNPILSAKSRSEILRKTGFGDKYKKQQKIGAGAYVFLILGYTYVCWFA